MRINPNVSLPALTDSSPQTEWSLELTDPSPAWLPGLTFSLRHPQTGQLLSSSQEVLSSTSGLGELEGLEVREVAGTGASTGDLAATWRMVAFRAPALGGSLSFS